MRKSFSIAHADEKTKGDAKLVLITTLAISFLPLVIGFLSAWAALGWKAAFLEVFLDGDLYFYAMSICAAILILTLFDNKVGNVEIRVWSTLFVVFCGCFMAFYIGQTDQPTKLIRLHGWLSVGFLAISAFLNYRVYVLANSPPPPPENINRSRANEMADDVEVNYDA